MHVPDSSHYRTDYLGARFERLASYREQLLHCLLEPPARSVLIVGKGDDLVPMFLRGRGLQVTTLDVASDLRPDVVASVVAIPARDDSFDVAICCQVLEHLPFADVTKAMHELCRVARRRVIISVPDNRRLLSLRVRFLRWNWSMQLSQNRWPAPPLPPSRLQQHGHHWEVGFAGHTPKAVRKALAVAGWRLCRNSRVHDLPWHLFMVFDAKGAKP